MFASIPPMPLTVASLFMIVAVFLAPGEARGRAPSTDLTTVRVEQMGEDFRWSGRLARRQTIEIRGINGHVRAAPAEGDRVEVRATWRGQRSQSGGALIQVAEHASGVTISVAHPPQVPAPSGARDAASPSDGDRDTIDFQVSVPAAVRFIARTVNGDIEADSLSGDVEAHTVEGDITLSTAGHALADTVNGSIEASLGASGWLRPMEFRTVRGGITLELPPNANARIHAHTVRGEICSELAMTHREHTATRVRGTLGRGGPELALSTVHGDLHVRRARTAELSMCRARSKRS